jgi:hypothetical protein
VIDEPLPVLRREVGSGDNGVDDDVQDAGGFEFRERFCVALPVLYRLCLTGGVGRIRCSIDRC